MVRAESANFCKVHGGLNPKLKKKLCFVSKKPCQKQKCEVVFGIAAGLTVRFLFRMFPNTKPLEDSILLDTRELGPISLGAATRILRDHPKCVAWWKQGRETLSQVKTRLRGYARPEIWFQWVN